MNGDIQVMWLVSYGFLKTNNTKMKNFDLSRSSPSLGKYLKLKKK
jgi:hypothetical protein